MAPFLIIMLFYWRVDSVPNQGKIQVWVALGKTPFEISGSGYAADFSRSVQNNVQFTVYSEIPIYRHCLFHRNIWRYTEVGGKFKYSITRNLFSETCKGTHWGWSNNAQRNIGLTVLQNFSFQLSSHSSSSYSATALSFWPWFPL